jgi:CRISPR type III-A-associated RAMP protein Csm5
MAKIELRTVTPVHIGSGRFLMNKNEYVFGKENNIGIVDDKKVLELAGEERIQAWVASIEEGRGLIQFLKSCGITATLQKISKRILSISCDKTRAKELPNIKENIHNGQGFPYIPGSSIKGAIRSAVLNQLIRGKRQKIEYSQLMKSRKPTAQFLEKNFFGEDANHDVFRFVRIGDAHFEANSTEAFILENMNLMGNPASPVPRFDSTKNQLVEMIGKSKVTKFNIGLDTKGLHYVEKYNYMKHQPTCFSDLNTLFEIINHNTLTLLGEEIAFWSEYDGEPVTQYLSQVELLIDKAKGLKQGECLLRIAHGSGWRFITGNWAYDDELVDVELYDEIVSASRPDNNRYEQFPFPKSRRITSNMELPGFVLLKKTGD